MHTKQDGTTGKFVFNKLPPPLSGSIVAWFKGQGCPPGELGVMLASERDRLYRRMGEMVQSRHFRNQKRPLSWVTGGGDADHLSRLLEQLEISHQQEGVVTADLRDGELIVKIADVPVLDQMFAPDNQGPFILAQWRDKTRRLSGKRRTQPHASLVVRAGR